jgi:uncharacterized membrane protein
MYTTSYYNLLNIPKVETMDNTLKSIPKKISLIVSFSIFSLFLLTFVIFPVNDAYSFKMHCVEGTDIEKYPICEYEYLWNESELFNELVVNELANKADDINADPESFQKIYSDSINKVNRENPGLYDKCQEIKNWISKQLAQK